MEEKQLNGADEPTVVCVPAPHPSPLAKPVFHFQEPTAEGKESEPDSQPTSDLFKVVFSTCWSSVSFKSPEACIIKEGKMAEPLTLNASWIHKPIITAYYHMQILNSISISFQRVSFSHRLLQNSLLDCET